MRFYLVLAAFASMAIGGIVYDSYVENKEKAKAEKRIFFLEKKISFLEKEIFELKRNYIQSKDFEEYKKNFFSEKERTKKKLKKLEDLENLKDYFTKDGFYDSDTRLTKNLLFQLEEAKKSVVRILVENIYKPEFKEVVPSEPLLPPSNEEKERKDEKEKNEKMMMPPLLMSKTIPVPVTSAGFVYKKEKDALYIITTEHAVSIPELSTLFDTKRIGQNFYLLHKEEKIPLEVLVKDKEVDFCMMKAKTEEKEIPEIPFSFGNSDKLKAGSLIFAITMAKEEKIISKGYVRSEKEIKEYDKKAFIASIEANPGDSGAPVIALMDGKPEIVGLISATRKLVKGGDSCIKINIIKKIIKDFERKT